MSDVLVFDIQTADGLFIKHVHVPKADTWLPQHAHHWGHSTIIAAGAVAVWNGAEPAKLLRAPASVFIPAGIEHMFLTVEDGTILLCCHNLREADVAAVMAAHGLGEAG